MRAPAALHARAIDSVCTRISTVAGTDMTTGSSPPTVTPPAITGLVLDGAACSGCEERVTRRGGRAGNMDMISSTAKQMSAAIAPDLKCNKPIAVSVEGEETRRSPDVLRRREGATGSLHTLPLQRVEQELRRVVRDGGGRAGGDPEKPPVAQFERGPHPVPFGCDDGDEKPLGGGARLGREGRRGEPHRAGEQAREPRRAKRAGEAAGRNRVEPDEDRVWTYRGDDISQGSG